jgi:hypothetical protein
MGRATASDRRGPAGMAGDRKAVGAPGRTRTCNLLFRRWLNVDAVLETGLAGQQRAASCSGGGWRAGAATATAGLVGRTVRPPRAVRRRARPGRPAREDGWRLLDRAGWVVTASVESPVARCDPIEVPCAAAQAQGRRQPAEDVGGHTGAGQPERVGDGCGSELAQRDDGGHGRRDRAVAWWIARPRSGRADDRQGLDPGR